MSDSGSPVSDDIPDARVPATGIPDGAVRLASPRATPVYRFLSSRLLRLEAWLQSHGGTGLRWAIRVFWAILTVVGLILLFGPVINKPLTFDDIISSAEDATDSWIVRSFDAEFTLVRGDDGRLTMQVEERITAFFPDDVNESAVERVIATQYEGHDLDLRLTEAVFDGTDVTPDVDVSPIRTTITVDADERLAGDHTLILRYDLHDVAYPTQDESSRAPYQQLEWDAFGPEWSHGTAEKSLTVRIPEELVAAEQQQPRGGIQWLLLSETVTMTPEPAADGMVEYEISNDQNMPPHSTFWFRFAFDPGTFTMPEPSAVYWVQLYGPFVPLALLAITLLFALAARAVAWADARGRAWFVMQDAPRRRGTESMDARLWRAWRTGPLVDALVRYRETPRDKATLRALVRTAHRTGRWGDIPNAAAKYRGSAWREQFTQKLRRTPRGFVRDAFLGAAVALTAIQWGLVRQVSEQVALTEYWWPVPVVIATTVLALVILTVASSARPLTRTGALAVEHLRGQQLFLDQTLTAERTDLFDPQLPYVVMFAPPRRARRIVGDLLDREGISRRARADPDFVTGGRLAVRTAAILAFVALTALAVVVPSPSASKPDSYDLVDDIEGSYGFFVTDADIEATLVPTSDGRLEISIVERFRATVADGTRAIPQVTRAWRDHVDGHDQQLTVEAITVDGKDVPFDVERHLGHALVQSRIPDRWAGEHDVVVRYSLRSAASARAVEGGWLDRVQWTALVPRWTSAWSGVDTETERLRVAVRVPTALADRMTGETGWLDERDRADVRPPIPFERPRTEDGHVVFVRDAETDSRYEPDSLWPSDAQYVGVDLQFADGTFAGPDEDAWQRHTAWTALPWLPGPVSAAIAVILSLAGLIAGQRHERIPGLLRDTVRWVPVALTLAQFPLLFWATSELYDGDPLLVLTLWSLGASLAMTTWVLIATRRRKA